LTFSKSLNAQVLSIEGFCHTDTVEIPTAAPDELYRGGASMGDCYPDYPGPYYMKVYVHAVRRDGCVGGQTIEKIKEAMARTMNNFREQNIYLVWDDCGIQEHCFTNTYIIGYLGVQLDCNPSQDCLSQFNHTDGIDIYFGGDDVVIGDGGVSIGSIPSRNGRVVMIAGEFWVDPFTPIIDTDVLTHELGHAFGLFHTFQTWASCDPCQERVDGSNADICGDLVCDTPADPYGATLFDVVPGICEFDTDGDF